MPYKYIGRKTNFKGKSLWEIVGNLKNFGVSRIVARNVFERYPEPSYLKILKVEPLTCPEKETINDRRKVRVLVEKTFRGKTLPAPITIESTSYKDDYKLIPKDEEDAYCRKPAKVGSEIPIFPKFTAFPPLFKELLIKELKNNGEKIEDEPQLEIVYNKKNYGKYRIAEDGERPTENFHYSIENSPNKDLYNNIKMT